MRVWSPLLLGLVACKPTVDEDADIAALAIERVMAGERLLTTEPLYLRRPDAVPAAAAPNARVLGK